MTLHEHKKGAVMTAAMITIIASVSVATAVGSPAQAIPFPQQSCAHGAQWNTATHGWQPVHGSVVSIHNGGSARQVVLNFNADAGVDPNAEIRLGYSVDGGDVRTPGAQNFANNTQFWQTRHSMVVLHVPAGTHSVQPYWRISGSPGKQGVLASRCLTAEAFTS